MEEQNKIVLSIGSNQGDRKDLIQQAINAINRKVATVISVSRLYESPSWGFESEPFYNCAILVHTSKSPSKVLTAILKIEKEFGRIRTDEKGYKARPIDIDIINCNNEILQTNTLQIPHVQMENRRFVLLPMKDLETEFVHPILHKTVAELIADCVDVSDCKAVAVLENPFKNTRINNYSFIAVEGNIGAGKTTLAHKIAADFNAKKILERFADNPFLPKFYKDQARYAFPLEMSFLADRYQQISDDLAQLDLFKDFIVADYHIFKSLIFAKVTVTEDEFRLYRKLFEIIYKEIPKPDLYIYLYQNTERLLQNIKKRGRSYEQEIPSDYLDKINQGYFDFIKTHPDLNILVLDVSDRDFVKNQSDYIYILEEIDRALAAH
ncbi:2-amino-4-hydroxy-6-hydroxymethyldihydropteridine diphosphokinase [Flavobacterium tegetincola]|uniref:2-amino-4-hydroxy-6- hydroxymethyldihydropteridine diphosphokinase n=1 Tax=Flavobacterium tegetincola TaxID=150172 RepID=UPI00042082E3|nr:2-amino-4-hydroxy-6-hydroxymethyldihydropteridine diphosphokinase [Flavobacterium tegetincola]